MKTYGHQYVLTSHHHNELMKFFHRKCEQHSIVHNNKQIFEYLNQFEEKQAIQQMSLFD